MGSRLKLAVGVVVLIVVALLVSITISARGIIDTRHGDIINRDVLDLSSPDEPTSDFGDVEEGTDADLIKRTVEEGWSLRLEAGLDRNRGLEADYKEQLRQYYSSVPLYDDKPAEVDVDEMMRGTVQPPPEKEGLGQSSEQPPARHSPDASELEKQWGNIDNGRYNERVSNFIVQDFGVDDITYQKLHIEGDKAEVIVDIKYWSEFIRTNPDGTEVTSRPHGGERHTFLLAREDEGWRITSDTFTILPGFEP